MKLLIVESPGKIDKLKHILGSGWDVMASYGHIRDLPVKELGISKDFNPIYVSTQYGVKTIAKLKEAVAKADEVYLATDPDREGEAIAWHLADELKLSNYKRVTYTSITPKEVMAGIGNARSIDMALVKAQEARRVLDRLCGYLTSLPLSKAIGETVSAGRVQSPAVRLVVEREREIRSFKTTLHYGVKATFEFIENVQDGWTANLQAGQEYITDRSIAEKISAVRTFEVVDFTESNKNAAPPAPFTTSTLQQAASNALKFKPKETMSIAQALYEAGLITYMRTDSPNLSDEAYEEIKSFAINENLPVADQKRTWKSKDGSQEAHEAIRPTDIAVYDIEAGEKERQLYKLIRDRALACVLKDAVYSVRQAKLKALIEENEVFFEAKGSTLIEQGWKIIFAKDQTDDNEDEAANAVPSLKIGSKVTAQSMTVTEHKTKAPSRYTQASLIRELEKAGIGRPATYASIMSNILDREYIEEDAKNKLSATELGEKLYKAMLGSFSFLNLDYTKKMEEELDNIAENKSSYLELVSNTYETLTKEVDEYEAKSAVPCPKCGSPLKHICNKEKGYDFFACENDECKATFDNVNGIPTERKPKITNQMCLKCGSSLKHCKGINKSTGKAYDFFACENEECKTTFDNVNGKPAEKKPKITDQTCLKCGSPLKHCKGVSKSTGTAYNFFICENEECQAKFNNENGKPVEQTFDTGRPTEFKCPECGKMLMARSGKQGKIYFACSGYPDCKKTFPSRPNGTPNFEPSTPKITIKAKRKSL